MKKLSLGFVLVISSVFLAVGCSGSGGEGAGLKLSLVGSTSVSPLIEKERAAFEAENSGSKIDIQSVGSSAGIKAVLDGTAEVGMSSRDLTVEEKGQLDETVIALDAIAVVVNDKNPVKDISKDNLKKVFNGEITNWSQLGGADSPITVINREEGSGTRTAFEDLLKLQIKRDDKEISGITDNALITDGNGSVKQNVSTKENAIGYISLGVIDGNIKAVDIEGVKATEENVKNKSYSLFRPFIFLTKGEPREEAQSFMEFMLSETGQNIVSEMQYIPVN